MKANLSIKEQKFLNAYLETGVISEAAKRAGSKAKDIPNLYMSGRAILDRLGVTLRDIQELNGITDEYLTKKLSEGMSADKIEVATFRGKICDEKAYPDLSTRSKYLDMAHRLRGAYVDKLELTGKDGGDIVLQIGPAKRKRGKLEID